MSEAVPKQKPAEPKAAPQEPKAPEPKAHIFLTRVFDDCVASLDPDCATKPNMSPGERKFKTVSDVSAWRPARLRMEMCVCGDDAYWIL